MGEKLFSLLTVVQDSSSSGPQQEERWVGNSNRCNRAAAAAAVDSTAVVYCREIKINVLKFITAIQTKTVDHKNLSDQIIQIALFRKK